MPGSSVLKPVELITGGRLCRGREVGLLQFYFRQHARQTGKTRDDMFAVWLNPTRAGRPFATNLRTFGVRILFEHPSEGSDLAIFSIRCAEMRRRSRRDEFDLGSGISAEVDHTRQREFLSSSRAGSSSVVSIFPLRGLRQDFLPAAASLYHHHHLK
jgi:hypothetical protein